MGEDGATTGSTLAGAPVPPAVGRRPGSRLGQMKFMQRAVAKAAQATAAASPQVTGGVSESSHRCAVASMRTHFPMTTTCAFPM